MFTGIIESTGIVEGLVTRAEVTSLTIRCGVRMRGLKLGDSLAVNGCCLTVVKKLVTKTSVRLVFNLLAETLDRTNLRFAIRGTSVNLERSLGADGRFDGHFVTGHVDGTGTIKKWEQHGGDWLLEVEPPSSLMELIVEKGSIAVDGISLTVARTTKRRFQAWIIPHTFKVTNLHNRKVGDQVNLETDVLAKQVHRFMSARFSNG